MRLVSVRSNGNWRVIQHFQDEPTVRIFIYGVTVVEFGFFFFFSFKSVGSFKTGFRYTQFGFALVFLKMEFEFG